MQINPGRLFTLIFCTLTFCQRSVLLSSHSLRTTSYLGNDKSKQNKPKKQRSRASIRLRKSREGRRCIWSEAALIFSLDLTDLLQGRWRFQIWSHLYLPGLMNICLHLWFWTNRPSSWLPVLNFCVTLVLTSPAHHPKISISSSTGWAPTPPPKSDTSQWFPGGGRRGETARLSRKAQTENEGCGLVEEERTDSSCQLFVQIKGKRGIKEGTGLSAACVDTTPTTPPSEAVEDG